MTQRLFRDNPDAIKGLRAILDEAGYDESGLQRLLSAGEFTTLGADDEPVHSRRLSDDPLSTLTALFGVGSTLDERRLAQLFPEIERLLAAGILARSGDGIRSALRILPFDGMLIAGERSDLSAGRSDTVPPPHRASMTALNLTVRSETTTALDLGTGCGCIALAFTHHAARVTATDINPRALDFLAFNASLNGVNIDARQGSWLEPVAGQRFDLVSINPPFVVSPDTELVYRDSPLPRDEVSRLAVALAGEALTEGGFATVLVSWAHGDVGSDWWDPVKLWIEDLGCDVWILRSQTVDPLSYAASWNRDLRAHHLVSFGEALDRWLAYYEAEGIEALTTGAIVLRRRDGANWARATDLGSGQIGPASAHLERMFDGVDRSRAATDEQVRALAFRVAPGVEIIQSIRSSEAGLSAMPARLRSPVGIDTTFDPRLLNIVLDCDGQQLLGALLDEHRPAVDDPVAAFRILLEEGWIVAAG